MSENVVFSKSKRFAVRIVHLYQYLTTEQREYVISKQLLKSGTSIGANVAESTCAVSEKDFISKYISHSRNVPKQRIGWNCYMTQTI